MLLGQKFTRFDKIQGHKKKICQIQQHLHRIYELLKYRLAVQVYYDCYLTGLLLPFYPTLAGISSPTYLAQYSTLGWYYLPW